MSNKSCPISLISVDSNMARINAFYVGVLFTLYMITSFTPLIYFLILDFSTRIFLKKEYSATYILAYFTKEIFKLPSIPVDAAPKKLASYFGLFFVILVAFVSFFKLTFLFYALSIILLACIFLEVVFSYCLGCEIYHLYQKIFV